MSKIHDGGAVLAPNYTRPPYPLQRHHINQYTLLSRRCPTACRLRRPGQTHPSPGGAGGTQAPRPDSHSVIFVGTSPPLGGATLVPSGIATIPGLGNWGSGRGLAWLLCRVMGAEDVVKIIFYGCLVLSDCHASAAGGHEHVIRDAAQELPQARRVGIRTVGFGGQHCKLHGLGVSVLGQNKIKLAFGERVELHHVLGHVVVLDGMVPALICGVAGSPC